MVERLLGRQDEVVARITPPVNSGKSNLVKHKISITSATIEQSITARFSRIVYWCARRLENMDGSGINENAK